MSPLKELPWNTRLVSVTCETFQPERLALKEVSRNMEFMEATPERSGVSAASYAMLDAPRNAPSIVVQVMFPHWSMDRSLSFSAWEGRLFMLMLSSPPVMATVWLPASAYVCVCVPEAVAFTVPSPQSMEYVPVAGMVMAWLAPVVSHVVTNASGGGAGGGQAQDLDAVCRRMRRPPRMCCRLM